MLTFIIVNSVLFGLYLFWPNLQKLIPIINPTQLRFKNSQPLEDRNILHSKLDVVPHVDLLKKFFFSPDFVRKMEIQTDIICPYNVFIFLSTCSASCALFILTFIWKKGHFDIFPWFISPLFIVLGTLICAYIPHMYMLSVSRKRVQTIDKHVGSFVDLIIICLDAGLTLSQALNFVAKECRNTAPLLARELAHTNLDSTLLLSSSQAFANLVQRIPSTKIKQLVSVIQQHTREGSVVHDSLYQMSVAAYRDNMTAISEKAQKMPGLLSALSVAFTIPMIFIVSFGPYLSEILKLFNHE